MRICASLVAQSRRMIVEDCSDRRPQDRPVCAFAQVHLRSSEKSTAFVTNLWKSSFFLSRMDLHVVARHGLRAHVDKGVLLAMTRHASDGPPPEGMLAEFVPDGEL